MKDDRKKPPRVSAWELDRLADVAAKLPILTEDFRALCQTSKGVYDETQPTEIFLPRFRPKALTTSYMSYNLDPHKDFPRELFRLLQDGKVNHILCWQEGGRSFAIQNRESFETVVLQRCCKSTDATFQSFLTTLVSYGFMEIRLGKRKGGYRHNLLQRGKPKRIERLIREGANELLAGGTQSVTSEAHGEETEPHCETSPRKTFIESLYQLLRKSNALGLHDAIYWEETGKSFKVHKLNGKFSTSVLQTYLSMECYSNFKNELVDRGFKCKDGTKYGVFEHPEFVQGQRCVSKTFDDVILQRRPSRQVTEQPVSRAKATAKRKRKLATQPKTSPSTLSRRSESSTKKKQTSDEKIASSNDTETTIKISSVRKRKSTTQDHSSKPKASTKKKTKTTTQDHSSKPKVSTKKKTKSTTQNSPKKKAKYTTRKEIYARNSKIMMGYTPRKTRKCSFDLSIPQAYRYAQEIFSVLQGNRFSTIFRWLPDRDGFCMEPELFNRLPKQKVGKVRLPTYQTFEKHLKSWGFQVSDGTSGGKIFKHSSFFDHLLPSSTSDQEKGAASNKTKSQKSKSDNSHSDISISSPEKENACMDEKVVGTPRTKTLAVANEVPGSPTHTKSIPLSTTKITNTKKSKKRPSAAISVRAKQNPNNRNSSSDGPSEFKPRLKSRATPRSKKRKIISTLNQQKACIQDVSSPASEKELQLGTKVCGINTVNSSVPIVEGSHVLASSKCKIKISASTIGWF